MWLSRRARSSSRSPVAPNANAATTSSIAAAHDQASAPMAGYGSLNALQWDFASKQALYLVVDAWYAHFHDHPDTWKMMFLDTTGDEEIRACRREVQAEVHAMFARFVAEEPAFEVPPEEVDAVAEVLLSGMAGLARWWLEHPDVPRATVTDAMTRVVLGLASTSPS